MRSRFLLTVCSVALVLPVSARAQQAPSGAAQQAPAWEPEAADIIVTAQKRTERLADVPVAASVVGEAALARHNVGDISDLNKIVPAVQLNSAFNSRVPVAIRGISTISGLSVGVPTGVSFEVDGVPIPSDTQSVNQVEDVVRVEVLEGPQATLGGRVASAGIINFITHAPTEHFKFDANVTSTTDNEERVNAFISGPVSDKLLVSAFGYFTHRDFPVNNIGTNYRSNQDVDGVRLKALYKATENFDIMLTGHIQRIDTRGQNYVYTYVTPGSTLLFPGSPLTQAVLLKGITVGDDNQTVNSPAQGIGSVYIQKDGQLNLDYRLPGLTLSSTTSYLHETQNGRQDVFDVATYFFNDLTGNPNAFPNYQSDKQTAHSLVQEFKAVSPVNRPLSYVFGAFYSDVYVNHTLDRELAPATQDVNAISGSKTYDLYGRTTLRLLSNTDLLTGLRVNHDVIDYTINQYAFVPLAPQVSSGRASSTKVVGDVTLQQHFSPRAMVYGTYARGYAPQAFDTSRPLSSNASLTPVPSTSINHFEVGTKASLAGGIATINISAWHTTYDNYQIQTPQTLAGFISPPTVLVAAGKARTMGIEADGTLRLSHNLRLNANAAYIDAKFIKFVGANCYGDQTVAQGCIPNAALGTSTQDLSGKTMPNSPKFKFNVGAEQTIPLSSLPFDLVLGADYSYRTKAILSPTQNPETTQKAFGILNLNLTAPWHSGRFSASGFVNNVFNQHYVVDYQEYFTSAWSGHNTVVGQPARDTDRYGGVRFNVQF